MSGDPHCAQEAIHTPGTIQPHGGFLAFEDNSRAGVVAASANAAAMLEGGLSQSEIFGRSLADIFGPAFASDVHCRRREGRLRGEAPWRSTLRLDGQALALDVTVHRYNDLINVEVERAAAQDPAAAEKAVHDLQTIVIELQEAGNDLDELARVAAEGVRLLTGYERIIVYKFDSDWNGQGIAEAKSDDWDVSLAGLRFPASDIPEQARALYQRSPMRWVADRDAEPVPLVVDPAWPDGQGPQAIDLSFAYLRSLSPVHLQIHRDLGINGTMSLSILHKGQLWGLMIGHHRDAHHLAPAQRAATAALMGAFALRVGAAESSDTDQARRGDLARVSALLAQMAVADDVSAALTAGEVTIGDLFASTGAAVLYNGTLSLLGQTPVEAEIRALVTWLQMRDGGIGPFQTNNLASVYPAWEPEMIVASGVFAVFLAADRADVLLWFRPEQVELVSWGSASRAKPATDVTKPAEHAFETWVEPRHGLPRPWEKWELDIAETLRHAITEVMVRSLHRITELHDRLRQSQKMEAVGQLTGGIAHDFNNLLAGILGSLEMLQGRAAQGRYDEMERYLGTAKASADRAASLTHRLLAFSRRQLLEATSVDVNRLVISMDDLIRRSVGPSIHVETFMAGGLWRTLCDANQLENALLNLAINARDAMPDGGRLTLEAMNAYLDESYTCSHPDVAVGQYVAVSVTDTGTGMTPEVVAKVFEPFFTTKPLGQGTGLGLSMVYGFAKQSNGTASIYSEPGLGTTIRLYLPRDVDFPLDGPSPSEALPVIAAEANKMILVVDDEPVLRMLVSDMLRDLGYDVIEAANGVEGLRILESRPDLDLLVSDVGLPGGMNGWQLAHAARAFRPSLKVLFITGFAENAVLGSGIVPQNAQVLTKPFPLDVLAAKVRSLA